MHRDFTFRRRAIVTVLGVLLLADAALAFYSWRLAASPRTPEQLLAQQTNQVKIFRGEIERAERIRKDLPATVADCERFEKSLLSASTGYSTVTGELGELARKSGLQIQGVTFHQTEVKGRPLSMVEMDASVTGNYLGVVKFMNGLQRSRGIFIVESLTLGTQSQTPGQGSPDLIRVGLRLRTYFRTEA